MSFQCLLWNTCCAGEIAMPMQSFHTFKLRNSHAKLMICSHELKENFPRFQTDTYILIEWQDDSDYNDMKYLWYGNKVDVSHFYSLNGFHFILRSCWKICFWWQIENCQQLEMKFVTQAKPNVLQTDEIESGVCFIYFVNTK